MERLSGVIRTYDWGDRTALAEILGHRPPGHPEAEYWLGAHPGGPGRLGAASESLDEAILRCPVELLGPTVAERFGGLPYLVKILAAGHPLSIQAHPSADQAVAGFEREERLGLDRAAPQRNYRDPSHKPELVCALTRFEARCGFRDPAATDVVLEALGPALGPVRDWLATDGPAGAAARLLRLPAGQREKLAGDVLQAARSPLGGDVGLGAELASVVSIGERFPGDVGVVVALLLNHVVLEPGQALFLPAGNVHAYLRGVAVEVMANSDNVLRGGLTAKHIDVEELMAIVDSGWGPVEVQAPTAPIHRFRTPVPEFEVTRIDTGAGPVGEPTFHPVGPETVLVTDGAVELTTADGSLRLERGQAAFVVPGDGPYRLTVRGSGRSTAWRVAVAVTADAPD